MHDNKCTHKKLFPMTGIEIASLFIMLIFLMVSIIVSIAGGAIIVPLSSYLMGFNARQAVALSNSIVLATATVKYIMALFKKNPFVPYKTIIDYNSALLMIPPMALFSSIGGIVVTFVPDVIVLLMLFSVNVFACVTGYFNLKNQLEKERAIKIQVYDHGDHRVPESGPIPTNSNEMKELLIINSTKNDDQHEGTQKAESKELKSVQVGNLSCTEENREPSGELALKTEQAEPTGWTGAEEKQRAIEAQKKVESSNFVWKKFWVFAAVLLLAIAVALLRPGKYGPSILNVHRCSSADWLLFLLYALAVGALPFYTCRLILDEQQHKKAIGWINDSSEVHITRDQFIFGTCWSGITGLASSIMGVGGGVMLNPLLMKLQYMPVTAAWTINMNTVMGKVATVIIHAKTGDLLYDYVFLYGAIIVIGIIISENTVLEIVKKTKSQLFYPITFLIVISISTLLVLFVGIDKMVQNSRRGIDSWAFTGYCK
jgi:uncharacterized membrane protein YfcA